MFKSIKARNVNLKLVSLEDAEFIYLLRVNNDLNKFLNKIDFDLGKQKKWLEEYKVRERQNKEFYFLINRNDTGESVGTIRLYDFIKDKFSFCWGSWILNGKHPSSAALESALLVYEIAFNELGFNQSHFDVRNENISVISFHEKFGARLVDKNELDSFFVLTKQDYYLFKNKYRKYLG